MLRNFSNLIKLSSNNTSVKTSLLFFPNYRFIRKISKTEVVPPEVESSIKSENNLNNAIKTFSGTYPYMPLYDHPLIPGYPRIIPANKAMLDKLIELNVEKTNIVLSVLKNPEKLEGLQANK